MITRDTFFGRAAILPTGTTTLYGVSARVLITTGTSTIVLPPRTPLRSGGPYFYVVAGGTTTVKEGSTTLKVIASGDVGVVLLGKTKWVIFVSTKTVAHTLGTNNSYRTVAIGATPSDSVVTEPTSYPSLNCDGNWRRARLCSTGAKANIWMTTGDVDSHFVSSVAAFSYLGTAFYFKESDGLLTGHGPLVDGTTVTWYDTCDEAAAASFCVWNTDWPTAIRIRITDPDHVPGSADYIGGEYTLLSNTSGDHTEYSGHYPLPTTGYQTVTVKCVSDAGEKFWKAILAMNVGGGVWYNQFLWAPGSASATNGPFIGLYTQTTPAPLAGYLIGGQAGSAMGACVATTDTDPVIGDGCYANASVEVIGYET